MFGRARLRLTLLYIALFALVLGLFSIVVYAGLATVLAPTFDLAPDLTSSQVAEAAYRETLNRILFALLGGDLAVLAFVGVAAWILAARTLGPIRDAHDRQRRFVADAAHEMRTPLAAVRATGESTLMGLADVQDLRDAIESMLRSTDRLTRLTNDLLLLARSDDGLLTRHHQTVDLSVVLAEAVEAFSKAHEFPHPVRVSITPGIEVAGDPDEIARIVTNLLDNAIRYGPDAPQPPEVSVLPGHREVEITVTDHGPGIAAVDLERIFEPFYRARSGSSRQPGTGLGLAIARSLAERNGGRLEASSRPGFGSKFRLILPRFR